MKETTTAVYLRVSTDSQDHASQNRAIQEFCRGRGLNPKVYSDKASGKSLQNRSALDRLQRDIFNGQINHIIFYSIDRFSRELTNGLVQIESWQKQKVRLTFVADSLDLDGGFMTDVVLKIIVSIKLAFAEHERTRIVERVRLGLAEAKARGIRLGRPASLSLTDVQQAIRQAKGNKQKAAKKLGVSLATIYNTLAREKKEHAA